MQKKNILQSRYIQGISVLLVGLLIGWFLFSPSHSHEAAHNHSTHDQESEMWTCSMHPQIKSDKPGKCPLCGMDLTPVRVGSSSSYTDPNAITLSDEAIALANVQTIIASEQKPRKNIRLFGVVKADERRIQSQTSHISGRIERLAINFVGETVRQGQTIATIYSPDLLTAQQELIEAIDMFPQQPALVEAAKQKLLYWKLSPKQIDQIIQSKTVSAQIDIQANTSGVVLQKTINEGDYITAGSSMYTVADLNNVWLVLDAYEQDIPFLTVGSTITYTTPALPNQEMQAKVTFVSPVIDANTRTAKVRAEAYNKNLALKPEMYIDAQIGGSFMDRKNKIVLPHSAVLWTGKRSIVYVKHSNENQPIFMLREVTLGADLGDSYVIEKGVEVGDEVVVNGAFTIDAAAQIEGKNSMMNPQESTDANLHMETIAVKGNCGMCKENIERAAKSIKGVAQAVWDMDTQQLQIHLSHHQTHLINQVQEAIAKAGYDTPAYKADDAVYQSLPACCHYR